MVGEGMPPAVPVRICSRHYFSKKSPGHRSGGFCFWFSLETTRNACVISQIGTPNAAPQLVLSTISAYTKSDSIIGFVHPFLDECVIRQA
jgi:hypothetical protein